MPRNEHRVRPKVSGLASFTFLRREAIVSAFTISAPRSCRERRERPIVGRHKLLMHLRRAFVNHHRLRIRLECRRSTKNAHR
ncbi:hypothetical protein PUN28_002020 [Cardiocondyla obscurior]|uniref:Uncharacterized protein n=1 Tax=Cardiocondyla obscurior TaxID=286306 RepID=A0AAW2GS81_9HYME